MAANERNRMIISDPGASICPWPIQDREYSLKVPGETIIPGWRVTASVMNENFFREDDIFSASFDPKKRAGSCWSGAEGRATAFIRWA